MILDRNPRRRRRTDLDVIVNGYLIGCAIGAILAVGFIIGRSF